MANPEHLDILKQGVEVWNQWREEHVENRPDLSEADLLKANLSAIDLRTTNLLKVNLRGADLSEANLFGANLSRADLSEANLIGADLSGAYLQEADLEGASLAYTQIHVADFSKTPCRVVCKEEARLRGSFYGDEIEPFQIN